MIEMHNTGDREWLVTALLIWAALECGKTKAEMLDDCRPDVAKGSHCAGELAIKTVWRLRC
jgi:hypothetical protein